MAYRTGPLGYFHRPIREDYFETLRFTHEAWRGRIRASKWIGAALPPKKVAAFDAEYQMILDRHPEELELTHRVKLEIFQAV